MVRTVNLDIAKTIDGVPIYVDYANLPDAEAIKKSITRARNQKSAQRRKDGTVNTRGSRSGTATPARSSVGAGERGPELPRIPETETMRARHAQEIVDHRAAGQEMARRHAHDAENVQRLTSLIDQIKLLDSGEKLAEPFLKELAILK